MTADEPIQEPDPSPEGIVAAWKAFSRHAQHVEKDFYLPPKVVTCPPCEQLASHMRKFPGRPPLALVEGCCPEGFGLADYWIRCCETRLSEIRRPRLV